MANFAAHQPVNMQTMSELGQLVAWFTNYSGDSTTFTAWDDNTIVVDGSFINLNGGVPDSGTVSSIDVQLGGGLFTLMAYTFSGLSFDVNDLFDDLNNFGIGATVSALLAADD